VISLILSACATLGRRARGRANARNLDDALSSKTHPQMSRCGLGPYRWMRAGWCRPVSPLGCLEAAGQRPPVLPSAQGLCRWFPLSRR